MSNKDLSRKPHHIRNLDNGWWYEETRGMEIIHSCQGKCERAIIPWNVVRNALKRKDKK